MYFFRGGEGAGRKKGKKLLHYILVQERRKKRGKISPVLRKEKKDSKRR